MQRLVATMPLLQQSPLWRAMHLPSCLHRCVPSLSHSASHTHGIDYFFLGMLVLVLLLFCKY